MNKFLSAVAIACAFVALPASAQWYAGAGLGSSRLTGGDRTDSTGTVFSGADSRKTSYKVYGGYQFTPNWGLEAQYTNLGKRDYTFSTPGTVSQATLSASQYSLAGTGMLPLNANFSLIGKLGASASRAKDGTGNNASKTNLMVGAGVQYSFSPQMALRLEYEDFGTLYNAQNSGGGTIRANNYSLSLQYAF